MHNLKKLEFDISVRDDYCQILNEIIEAAGYTVEPWCNYELVTQEYGSGTKESITWPKKINEFKLAIERVTGLTFVKGQGNDVNNTIYNSNEVINGYYFQIQASTKYIKRSAHLVMRRKDR